MKNKKLMLFIFFATTFLAANAMAGTIPDKMGTEDATSGWHYITYASGDISITCPNSSYCNYYTWELPMLHIDGVYSRVGKTSSTDPYYSFSDWYVEKDDLAHTCDATLGIWSQNNDIYLCNGVDEHSVAGTLTTCTYPSGSTVSCRKYYAREYGAYDDTNLTLSGEGIRSGIYMIKAYKYTSGGATYYRAFVVNNIG